MTKDFIIQYGMISLGWLAYLIVVMAIGYLTWRAIGYARRAVLKRPSFDRPNNPWFFCLLIIMLGFTSIGALSLPLYSFRGVAVAYTIAVGILFLASLVVVGKDLYKKKRVITKGFNKFIAKGYEFRLNTRSLFTIVATALLAVFLLADGMMGVVRLNHFADGSDANVHLSRIVDIAENGFSSRDGFFDGVEESRYAFNFVYALFIPIIIIGKLFSQMPFEVAIGSTVFFRLLQAVAMGAIAFALAKILLPERFKKASFAISALAIVVGFMVNHLATSYYPNMIVFAWYSILLITMFMMAQNKQTDLARTIMIVSAIAIAGTHPTYALMAAFLVVLFRAALFVVDLIKKHNPFSAGFWVSVVATVILMLPGVFVFLQPNLMTEHAINIESGGANINLLGINVFPPSLGLTTNIIWNLVQLVGFAALIFMAFKKNVRLGIIIALILGISIITVSNPFFVGLLTAAEIPYWVIRRFPSLNILLFYGITLTFGIVTLYMLAQKVINTRKIHKALKIGTGLAFAALLIAFSVTLIKAGMATYKASYEFAKLNLTALEVTKRIEREVEPHLKNRELVLASYYTSYYLPIVKPATVVYTDSLHMPPGAEGENRRLCQLELFDQLDDPAVLRAAGIKYVVVDKYQGDEVYNKRVEAMNQLPNDYQRLNGEGIYAVYQLKDGQTAAKNVASCSIYVERERGE